MNSTISAIKAKLISEETPSRSERTRWHQLLSRAREMMRRLSMHAKRELKRHCEQLKTLLKKLGGREPQPDRIIRARHRYTH